MRQLFHYKWGFPISKGHPIFAALHLQNQDDNLTDERISAWAEQVKQEIS